MGEEREHLFDLPLIIPEQFADHADLWIGAASEDYGSAAARLPAQNL